MTAFRIFLALIWLAIVSYTAITINNHGFELLSVFFGDMLVMAWPGQFNLDFLCMLMLSGLWVAWRHQFSRNGLLLSLLALFGGAMFLSLYLLIVSLQVKGNMNQLLLGKDRTA